MQNRFEILTPTGFQLFDGISKSVKDVLHVETNKQTIRVSFNHKFIVGRIEKIACSLKPKDRLSSSERVVRVYDPAYQDVLYDPINVSNGHVYIAGKLAHHNCHFLGSSATLINGPKIGSLPRSVPTYLIPNTESLAQFIPKQDGHSYVMLVDTARGRGLDYSAFTVIDITTVPYQVACTYRNSNISTLVYPEVILKVATMYNNAFVLIETNDLGQEVANILFYDLEYENVYMSAGVDVNEGGRGASPGLRTTKKTKAVGCDVLKDLIENDKLEVNDGNIIAEMTTFIRVGSTYKAEDGHHDDLMMCLVMFGYLTTQPVFRDLFDFSLREKFVESQLKELEDQMLPLGFFECGNSTSDVYTYQVNGYVEAKDDTFNF